MTDPDFDSAKKDFDRDGFVILRKYLQEAELDTLRGRALPLAASLMEKKDNAGKYRNLLKSLHRHDDWFERMLTQGRHIPLLRYLLNDGVHGASAAWFDRPEGESIGIDPHVDAIGREQGYDVGATIWFALDPVDESNGCLYYLKGSHRSVFPNVIPIPDIDVNSGDAIAAKLDPGDVVIHSALTVHWSRGNPTNRPRRAVSLFYFSASAHRAMQLNKDD